MKNNVVNALLVVFVGVSILAFAMVSFVVFSIYKDIIFSIPVISVLFALIYGCLLMGTAVSLILKGLAMLNGNQG